MITNPSLLAQYFAVASSTHTFGNTAVREIVESDPSRVLIAFSWVSGGVVKVLPAPSVATNRGIEISSTAGSRLVEIRYRTWGGITGSQWYGVTATAGTVIEITRVMYRPPTRIIVP